MKSIRINKKRFKSNFDELASIGATQNGGVNRPAFSSQHLLARNWFLKTAKGYGLKTHVDGAGNHSAILESESKSDKTLIIGSHLDSVPNGGAFDGALGIISALEVLKIIKELEIPIRYSLEIIDFSDEEGRFISLLGSKALSGELNNDALNNPATDPELFKKCLENSNINFNNILSASRLPEDIAGYLELHIEQGKQLMDRNCDIGIVTGIVGIQSYKIVFKGRADHAGTSKLKERKDASLGAAYFAISLRELMMKKFPDQVATIGNMDFEPGAFNVVPEKVSVSLEFRANNEAKCLEIEEAIFELALKSAERFSLSNKIEKLEKTSPVYMDDKVLNQILYATEILGLKSIRLPSGAGHDAQSLAPVCPSGMIFVPSVDGFSHSEKEYTKMNDCYNGANTLLHTVIHFSA